SRAGWRRAVLCAPAGSERDETQEQEHDRCVPHLVTSRGELEESLEEREVDEPDEFADDDDDAGLEDRRELAEASLELGLVVTADLVEHVVERARALAYGHDLGHEERDRRVVEARREVAVVED